MQEINTQVTKATVYTDRAMVTREGNCFLEKMDVAILLDKLPDNLIEDSVRVSASGKAEITIHDFKIKTKFYPEVPEARIQVLVDEHRKLSDEKKTIDDQISVLKDQKSFLKEIRVHSSNDISQNFERHKTSISEWRETIEFLGEEGNRLNQEVQVLKTLSKKLESEINAFQVNLDKVSGMGEKSRKQVQIQIEVHKSGSAEFEISYLTTQARWRPMYDARVVSKTRSVALRYFGAVEQSTGEDWNQIQVQMSTSRPQLGGNPPELHPWHISPFAEFGAMYDQEEGAMKLEAPKAVRSRAATPMKKKKSAKMRQSQVVAAEGASVIFQPLGASDVPGDGSVSKLLVMDQQFENEFKYLCIPKLSRHVYLSAKIKNTSEYPLLPGPISLFLNGSFIGKSSIQELITPDEKFDLALGVDEAIKVKHQLKKKFGDEKGLFTKTKVTQYAYQIELNNQKDSPETIFVQDQIPVSQDDEIKVKLEQVQPEENSEKNIDQLPEGALEWKILLDARSKKTISFSYAVSHGKDTQVSGL